MEINKVYNGDCLELMNGIPDKSIDMILCDLPYGTTQNKWDVIIPFEPLWEQYKRIIKDNGAIVLTASQPFTSQLVMSNTKMFKYEWIWEKPQGTNFLDCNKKPLKNHENILVFGLNSIFYQPQKTQGKEYKCVNSPTSTNWGKFKSVPTINDGTRYPKTVINFKQQTGIHPTQKPVALFEYLIKTYTNEGMTVLDNCSGSGTTAIACLNTNRNYILMEKDENYFNLSVERIDKHIKQNYNDNKLF